MPPSSTEVPIEAFRIKSSWVGKAESASSGGNDFGDIDP